MSGEAESNSLDGSAQGKSGEVPEQKKQLSSMQEFFENRAPGAYEQVTGTGKEASTTGGPMIVPEFPVLTLHCPDPQCGTPRPFDPIGSPPYLPKGKSSTVFVSYRCRTCLNVVKTYALRCSPSSSTRYGMFKFGEDFPFGEPIPRAVLDLLGDQKTVFLKGRAAENRDLGLGAFAYYRRVVENQSKQIFGAILRAAETLGASRST